MVSHAQYEALAGAVVMLPTPEEVFDHEVEVLCKQGVIKNPDELLGLRELLPKAGIFSGGPGRYTVRKLSNE